MSSESTRANRLEPLPPRSIVAGKYRIDAVLAEGGMGVIYRARHLVLDQPVAVKLMRPELAERPEAGLRFLNEARAAARLRGTHVARVLDSGAIANAGAELLYIVLEYLEGADLRTVLERSGPLPTARAVDFVLQACVALAEAHAAGIVHRDVKPENLFLTRQPDGREIVKLLDFGISKRMDSDPLGEASGNQSLGSPHYMAPEQMSAPHAADPRADIWSLGIVLYELLTLRVPFDGHSISDVCAQVLGRQPEPLRRYVEDIPEPVQAAVLGCLHKDREQRHANVEALAAALAPYGTRESQESLRSIQRIFANQHRTFDIDVDHGLLDATVDIAPFASEVRALASATPRPRGISATCPSSKSVDVAPALPMRPAIGRRAGAVAFAAALVIAFALPSVRAKAVEVLAPLGSHARVVVEYPSVQLSRLLPREGLEAAAIDVTPVPESAPVAVAVRTPPARGRAPAFRHPAPAQTDTTGSQPKPPSSSSEEALLEDASPTADEAAARPALPDDATEPHASDPAVDAAPASPELLAPPEPPADESPQTSIGQKLRELLSPFRTRDAQEVAPSRARDIDIAERYGLGDDDYPVQQAAPADSDAPLEPPLDELRD